MSEDVEFSGILFFMESENIRYIKIILKNY